MVPASPSYPTQALSLPAVSFCLYDLCPVCPTSGNALALLNITVLVSSIGIPILVSQPIALRFILLRSSVSTALCPNFPVYLLSKTANQLVPVHLSSLFPVRSSLSPLKDHLAASGSPLFCLPSLLSSSHSPHITPFPMLLERINTH